MFNDCRRHEQGKLPILHQFGQQKGVLGSESRRIEYTRFDVRYPASNGESRRVQVPNTTVFSQHMILEGQEPQVFGPTDQAGAIPHEPELKAVLLG
jgi:hypothetical protein